MNLQTWVVFLEFFGIGRAPEDVNATQQQEAMNIEGETKGFLILITRLLVYQFILNTRVLVFH